MLLLLTGKNDLEWQESWICWFVLFFPPPCKLPQVIFCSVVIVQSVGLIVHYVKQFGSCSHYVIYLIPIYFICLISLSLMAGHSFKSLRTYEQFMQDDCFHEKIMSRNVCFSSQSGVGILGCLTIFQSDGLQTYRRNLASIASTPERNKSFAKLNSDDINYFKKVLGERGVVQDEEKLDDANTDWMRKYKGSSKLMLQPRSTQEVNVFFQLPS